MVTEKDVHGNLKEWRAFAKTCRWRVYDGSRRVWAGANRGHPICLYVPIGIRCMMRKCPLRRIPREGDADGKDEEGTR